MSWWLPASFFVVALIYSMAGFGGGSSYIALLVLAGFAHDQIPAMGLVCNLVVVTTGAFYFVRAGHFNWRLFWPFMLGSVPLAVVGGRLPLQQELFFWLLGTTLGVAGLLLIWPVKAADALVREPKRVTCLALGAGLGFLSGMVGIGGGIFLAPLLLLWRWAQPKQVAAIAAMFILVNSVAGLGGQLWKNPSALEGGEWLWLAGAVFVGGQIGSRLGAQRIAAARVRQLTGGIVLAAALRILCDRL
jgi:uncharacterized membrane protein YfcA